MTKIKEKTNKKIVRLSPDNPQESGPSSSSTVKGNVLIDLEKVLKAPENTKPIKTFNTISCDEELEYLKNGKIPPEVIYTGEAGKKLLDIDKKLPHLYTLMVNTELWQMFMRWGSDLSYYFPKLRKCLGRTNDRLDIGTGNGLVSNMMALPLSQSISLSRRNQSIEAIQNGDRASILTQPTDDKPNFISCDLSPESLSFAEASANDDFHDLSKFFNLKYYPDTFQNFLKSNNGNKNNSPKFITMFNVLANFSYEDLKKILQDMYNYMGDQDIFVPSFFQIEDRYDQNFKNIYSDLGVGFRGLSLALYNNPETRDRCVSSFCNRYNISPEDVIFDVRRNNDGRDFIDVNLFVPENIFLTLPNKDGKEEKIQIKNQDKTIPGMTKFNVFKSYRMSQKEIKSLCESIGFKVENFLDTSNKLQIAPVLYK